ncbi:c-type cytochrome [Dyella psychrodurans]|uniref:Cytochrome c n=1 Tax=Dyella psychrodurans TaxID=1927960 RepID=A0A370WWC1_9GAMM|nr:cytochrome c [Dyella psychrodurans]RDS80317.1 cytochrome c [Dyella psychrodurans]
MLRRCLCLFALCLALPLHAANLSVDTGHGVRIWTTAQLLSHPDVQTVTIPVDVAFRQTMRYRAVPLRSLLPGLEHGDQLQFVACDGFSVDIPADTILNTAGAKAWLAIEDSDKPWPGLPNNKGDAGPFYVVWTRPAAAGVSTEQWPYQLARIQRTKSIAERFPHTAPAVSVPTDSPIRHGYAVFQRTCFACHTLNGEGDAHMGPDLNIPHSPTDYLSDETLRAFIRNPQSLHLWPQAKMLGFPTKESLSDADLDALLAYLRYMAQHKVTQ